MRENNSSKLAMAAPAALYITAAITFAIFAILTRQVEGTALPVLREWTTAAAIGIIIAAVIEIIRNNTVLGILILVSGTLLALGTGWAFEVTRAEIPPDLWEIGHQLTGYVWLAISIVMFLLLSVAAKVSWGLFFSQILLGLGGLLLAIGLIQRTGFGDGVVNVAGWIILVYGIYALYAGTAFLVNAVYNRKVMPV
jgi:succinate-acetate transporter protein